VLLLCLAAVEELRQQMDHLAGTVAAVHSRPPFDTAQLLDGLAERLSADAAAREHRLTQLLSTQLTARLSQWHQRAVSSLLHQRGAAVEPFVDPGRSPGELSPGECADTTVTDSDTTVASEVTPPVSPTVSPTPSDEADGAPSPPSTGWTPFAKSPAATASTTASPALVPRCLRPDAVRSGSGSGSGSSDGSSGALTLEGDLPSTLALPSSGRPGSAPELTRPRESGVHAGDSGLCPPSLEARVAEVEAAAYRLVAAKVRVAEGGQADEVLTVEAHDTEEEEEEEEEVTALGKTESVPLDLDALHPDLTVHGRRCALHRHPGKSGDDASSDDDASRSIGLGTELLLSVTAATAAVMLYRACAACTDGGGSGVWMQWTTVKSELARLPAQLRESAQVLVPQLGMLALSVVQQ
jgi:hypothetical protein